MASLTVSALSEIPSCVEQVLADETLCYMPPERRSDLKLCLFELLSNAIMHGEGGHLVHLVYRADATGIAFQVYEEHGHWDGRALLRSNRCLREGLLDEHGRGLYLVQMLCEEVAYCKDCKGVRVTIRFNGGAHDQGQ